MSTPSAGGLLIRYPSNCMAERGLLAPSSHAQSVRTSARSAAGAGPVVSFDFHDAVAARIVNEFLYAPTCLSFDIVSTVTGPGDST